jgi:carbonic anhydrase/acetyltransferase-like protein (isoleucine patch superfamily)
MPGHVFTFGDLTPSIDPDAFIADNATIIGNVTIAAGASVWYGCVLRSEFDPIVVGAGSNVQDGTIMHTDPGFPVTIGEGVTIGHAAVVHGATLEDGCLIGLHATVLNGATVGARSLIAAGALVKEGQEIPPGVLAAGVPAQVRRELEHDDLVRLKANAHHYVDLGRHHAANAKPI